MTLPVSPLPPPALSIVEGVFGRPDPGARPRWAAAVAGVAGFYLALFGLVPVLVPSALAPWAAALAARVHTDLGRQSELTMEPPAPPPLPSPPPTAVRAAPRVAVQHVRAAAPATSAQVVARAAAPLDLTANTFVTGTATSYAGGVTTSTGTSASAVEGTVDQNGRPAGAGSRARGVGLDEAAWSCRWPGEAASAEVNEKQVLLRVAVRPDGWPTEVKILSDPGLGFAPAARSCALKTRFVAAQDGFGNSIFAWSGPIRVRFIR